MLSLGKTFLEDRGIHDNSRKSAMTKSYKHRCTEKTS